MPRKRYSSEQIIIHLREAEVELAKGQSTAEVFRKLGITEQTYYLYGLLPVLQEES
jgi:putative transposase